MRDTKSRFKSLKRAKKNKNNFPFSGKFPHNFAHQNFFKVYGLSYLRFGKYMFLNNIKHISLFKFLKE